MDTQRIQALEDKIRDLHFSPVQQKHSFSKEKTATIFSEFWMYHVSVVIDLCKRLAKEYEGDLEVVWLAAILHDIARLDDKEPHDEIGAKMAQDILHKEGFSEGVIKQVSETILTHRCKDNRPTTLEQKILASADAISHFKAPFYFWVALQSDQDFKVMLEKNDHKIERDFNEKIFFEKEKESVREEYEMLKKWFNK